MVLVVRQWRVVPDETARYNTEVIEQASAQFDEAFGIYKDYEDKLWAMTDCASYNVMNEHGIREALTHDRNFEQMGFKALLRNPKGWSVK